LDDEFVAWHGMAALLSLTSCNSVIATHTDALAFVPAELQRLLLSWATPDAVPSLEFTEQPPSSCLQDCPTSLALLAGHIAGTLSTFPTTLAEDLALRDKGVGAGSVTGTWLQFRIEKKRLLQAQLAATVKALKESSRQSI
jgi:hypothetical protein